MDFILDSGAKLVVTAAPFPDANRLRKAIMKALKGVELSELDMKGLNIAEAIKTPAMLSALFDKILSIASSDEVEEALFKCFERSHYENHKVTKALFDDPTQTEADGKSLGDRAREDYFTICYKVMEVNVKPFFSQTFSALKALSATTVPTPKS